MFNVQNNLIFFSLQGDDGLKGYGGLPGNYGPRGEDGIPGINGIDGLPGLSGIKGSRGDPGSAILFGELGVDGDEGRKLKNNWRKTNLNNLILIFR